MTDVEMAENRTFDEIEVGESATIQRTLSAKDIELFAFVSGDVNPSHMIESFETWMVDDHHVVGHSMWTASLFSAVLGNLLPGAGTVYKSQDLKFRRPVHLDDEIRATVTAKSKDAGDKIIAFDCHAENQDGEVVVDGTAEVYAPVNKVKLPRPPMPEVQVRTHGAYERLIKECSGLGAIATAIAHPCSDTALSAAVDAAAAGLIEPILVGPQARIESLAREHDYDISKFRLIDAAHSHDSAAKAVAVVNRGEAEVLMKGSLHTDELLHEVMKRDTGLRTERRVSHCFVIDVPTYPEPLIVTDAAINIAPDLETKVHIVQNAVELAHALGIEPRVAVLSAVETVTGKIPTTLEAAALCKMADRGQITGCTIDGPLAMDNAISVEAARIKGIKSPVAGHANVLLAPNLEAGNMLAKNLTFLSNADAAGIVLGARVPIILTSRADSLRSRMASCAIAARMAHARRGTAKLAAD